MPITLTANNEIRVAIPLTATSGKIRVKQRSIWEEYGLPVATCQTPFAQNCYIEWQVGYDVVVAETEKLKLTTLKDIRFTGANRKEKALYELSEYVYYLVKWGIIAKVDLEAIDAFLAAIPDNDLFDVHPELSIKRSHFIEKKVNGIPFSFSRVEYPILVHKFGNFEVLAEIITREKQRAIGVQPMLYLCFPITELVAQTSLLGRPARSKEHAEFVITKDNAFVFLQLLRLFGMLSANHRHDIREIIKTILTSII